MGLGLFHGSLLLSRALSMEFVDPMVFVLIINILVGVVLAFQDSRKKIKRTGLGVVNQNLMFHVQVAMQLS